jgi:thymidylate kinase
MLTKTRELIEELRRNRIRYCHWKSNLALAESLAGETDIDLLIHRQHAGQFRILLSQLCFQPAVTTGSGSFPSVEHYYALDEESGVLVHVHAYYRVITGESLTKNYHLPIEEMLLQNTREEDSVVVPTKSAELAVFTIRIMMKHASIVELLLLYRYWQEVLQEINWLLESGSIEESVSLVEQWLPALDGHLLAECITALKTPASLFRRVDLGLRLRSQLRPYARHSMIPNWLTGVRKFLTMFLRRLHGTKRGMVPRDGGAVIAFVGSEATGKSTLISEMRRWLGEHFDVEQIHAGKPKSTWLTLIPNIFVPALRSLLPGSRTTQVEAEYAQGKQSERTRTDYPLTFAIRSALLAYDRHALLTRAYGEAANSTIVLCDRYPSLLNGAPDSPQLSNLVDSANGNSLRHRMARIEDRLYREIPAPDLVVYLSAPLDVTLSRNAARGKTEPEEYVRRRHARTASLQFGKTPVYEINTDQPFDQTVREVKTAIWNAL